MIVKLTRWFGSELQTIDVKIDEQGNIEATVEGMAGPACADVSKFLDELGQVTEDQNTAEYYQQSPVELYRQITETSTLYGGLG